MVTYSHIQAKSILNKLKYVDSWYWTKYSINSYQGCQIGCIYCNSRNDRYQMPIDFENDIKVKINLPKVLQKELRSKLLPDIVGISGATDPYQAAERKYHLTKSALELLNKNSFPVHIITKSRMIRRDLDLIEKIAKNTHAIISVTLTTLDKEIANFLEKGAPSPEQRLELIETIKVDYPEIIVGISATPIMPFLSDAEEQLHELINESISHKADFILPSVGLSMNNQQAQWFLQKIRNYKGECFDGEKIYRDFKDLYKFSNDSFVGKYDGKEHPISNLIYQKQTFIERLSMEKGIKTSIPRWIPNDFRKYNYTLAEEIFSDLGKFNTRDPLYFAAHRIQNLTKSLIEYPELISQISSSVSVQQNIIHRIEKHGWKSKQRTLGEFF